MLEFSTEAEKVEEDLSHLEFFPKIIELFSTSFICCNYMRTVCKTDWIFPNVIVAMSMLFSKWLLSCSQTQQS